MPSKADSRLFRLRDKDSAHGISSSTLAQLATVLGLPETQVIHEALLRLAAEVIPAYKADEGPVSDKMLGALKKRVPQGQYKSMASTLFRK